MVVCPRRDRRPPGQRGPRRSGRGGQGTVRPTSLAVGHRDVDEEAEQPDEHERAGEDADDPEGDRELDRVLPGHQRRPRQPLERAGGDQVGRHHRDAHRREPVVPAEQPLAVPGRVQDAREEVDHHPQEPRAEDAEHDHVSMADDPVGEVDEGLEGERRLERALEAGEEVEDHAGVEPADGQVVGQRPGRTLEGGEEVDDDGRDHHLHRDRRDHRPVLEEHRDRRVEEVVDAVQRVEERQSPEPDEREPVAPDRLLEQDGHEVVHHAPAQRRDEQADEVVDEQAADCAGAGAGDEVLRHEVAHRVDHEGPDEGGHEVPVGDVHRPLDAEDGRHEVDRHQQQADLRQGVDPDGRLAPLQPLGLAEEDADGRREHDELPGGEDEVGEPLVEHRAERQPGHDPVEHAEEAVGEEAIGDRVGVDHPPAAGRQEFLPVERVVADELEPHQEAAQHRDEHERERGQEVPLDQPAFDQVAVPGQALLARKFRVQGMDPYQLCTNKCAVVRGRASASRLFGRAAVGRVFAERVGQDDRQAEDDVRRRRDPPGQAGVVGDPVAAEQHGLEPGEDPVEAHGPDRQDADGRDEEPLAEAPLAGEGRQREVDGDAQEHAGEQVEAAADGQDHPVAHRVDGLGLVGELEGLLAEREGEVDPDQFERVLAGNHAADDVEEQARHRAEDPQQEPGGGGVGGIEPGGTPAGLGVVLVERGFEFGDPLAQGVQLLAFRLGVHGETPVTAEVAAVQSSSKE